MDFSVRVHEITGYFCFIVKVTVALWVEHHFLYHNNKIKLLFNKNKIKCIRHFIFQYYQGEKPTLWLCMDPPVSALLKSKQLSGDFKHTQKMICVLGCWKDGIYVKAKT